jgi:acetylornithine/N-succinyldiaminopimelate aminotransferase
MTATVSPVTPTATPNDSLIARHKESVFSNYGKLPVALVRGEGSKLFDANNKEYIDLFAGFGGTILGHCHPDLIAAINHQAGQLWTVGNQFYSEPQIRLAEALNKHAFAGQAFFCHSGAEANEAAIKLARISAPEGRYKIISCYKGFHGRTLGALSATATAEYQKGFGPMMSGFAYVPYNDLAALEAAMDNQTAGVLVEPMQGEGGLNVPDQDYFKGVRALCDKNHVALIFDEVWTGVGRTGLAFGHQHFGVTPDIMSMGKALGGGVPVGGILAKKERAAFFKPGTHGCTLGGNPICAAVGAAIWDVIDRDKLCQHAAKLGDKMSAAIRNFKNAGSKIKEVRGKGLFIGIELATADGSPVLQAALARGLIINVTSKNVIRICPAITLDEATANRGLEILEAALHAV